MQEKTIDSTDIERYLKILEDSQEKKDKLLARIQEICTEHEECMCGEKLDVDRYNELCDEKGEIIEQLELLDDGFAALYDRVAPVLRESPKDYTEHLRRMQQLIAAITDKTALIQASEMRLQARIDRLVQAGKPSKAYVSAPTAVDKYNRTMNNAGIGTSVFVDNKRRK